MKGLPIVRHVFSCASSGRTVVVLDQQHRTILPLTENTYYWYVVPLFTALYDSFTEIQRPPTYSTHLLVLESLTVKRDRPRTGQNLVPL